MVASRELAVHWLPMELSEGPGAERSRGTGFLNLCVLGKVLDELGPHLGPGEGGLGAREALAGALSHLCFL